jgi:C4-dicarboxylate transporter DctQ subunit|tara:strand:- start:8 stop:493 length:486 start_codon:yes stop_codon:yes gene_type:complete
MFKFLDKQVSLLSSFLLNLALIAFIILTFSVIYEVIARSILNKPTIWSLEIVTYMISCVAFFGSAYVLRINKHLEINLFTKILPIKVRLIFNLIANIIAFIFCFIAFYYGCKLINLSYILGVVSVSELRVPLWIPQMTVPIGFFALSLEFLVRILRLILNR